MTTRTRTIARRIYRLWCAFAYLARAVAHLDDMIDDIRAALGWLKRDPEDDD